MINREKPSFPAGITTDDGRFFSFKGIHQTFTQTAEGEELKRNVRFGVFKPDAVSNSDWKALLGADVCNLEHNLLTYGQTRAFLTYGLDRQISPRQTEQMLFTALIHDWPEAVLRDKPEPSKTAANTKAELDLLPGMVSKVLGIDGNDSSVRMAVSILAGMEPGLSPFFNAIEKDGYVATAVRAWKHTFGGRLSNFDTPTKLALESACLVMAAQVIPRHLSLLIKYTKAYPAVLMNLQRRAAHIEAVYKTTPDSVIDQCAAFGFGMNKEVFDTARCEWERFTRTSLFKGKRQLT